VIQIVDYDVYNNEYYQLSSSIKKCTAKLTVNGWHQKPYTYGSSLKQPALTLKIRWR